FDWQALDHVPMNFNIVFGARIIQTQSEIQREKYRHQAPGKRGNVQADYRKGAGVKAWRTAWETAVYEPSTVPGCHWIHGRIHWKDGLEVEGIAEQRRNPNHEDEKQDPIENGRMVKGKRTVRRAYIDILAQAHKVRRRRFLVFESKHIPRTLKALIRQH